MTSCERYYAAACQIDLPNPQHRDEIAPRVKRMLDMIDYAVTGYEPFFDVRLVVFPEFAHAAPIYPTVEKLRKRLAVPIPKEKLFSEDATAPLPIATALVPVALGKVDVPS